MYDTGGIDAPDSTNCRNEMSRKFNDSFLPSGGIESPCNHRIIPPPGLPSRLPEYTPSSNFGSLPQTNFLLSHNSAQHTPMSPPKTRSASADEDAAALLEDWRAYAQKLRNQHQGERAHLLADRARVEEVMEEERQIWDKERETYKAHIAELEALLLAAAGTASSHGLPPLIQHKARPAPSLSPTSGPVSVTESVESITSSIPQESGRDTDGSPFYAPAPKNPSRTFDISDTAELRVDDVVAPRECAIRVTSKELTSSDFGPRLLPNPGHGDEVNGTTEVVAESIDISHIQPELDGVAIRVSAVSPTFAAKVLSPQRSPPKLSPSTKPPPRDVANLLRDRTVSGEIRTLQVTAHPEKMRLTMHAGHTPNHSISRFSFLRDDSGKSTPTQARHSITEITDELDGQLHTQVTEDAREDIEDQQGDKALSGPLGLVNEPTVDDDFLTKLTEKLEEEKRRSEGVSPASESGSRADRSSVSGQQEPYAGAGFENADREEEGPRLKMKPSFNFGRPMGSI